MSGGTSKIAETSLGQKDDGVSIGKSPFVDLRLDVGSLGTRFLESRDIDLIVKVSNVADDGIVLHLLHVGKGDDVAISGGSGEDVNLSDNVLDGVDFVSSHQSLEGTDGVDFSNNDSGSLSLERFAASLADVSISSNETDLSSNHDIGGSEDSVDQRVSASIDVIELALGDRVIDVEGGEQKRTLLPHLVESVNSSGGLLRNSLDVGDDLVPVSRVQDLDSLQELINDLDLFVSVILFQDGRVSSALYPL